MSQERLFDQHKGIKPKPQAGDTTGRADRDEDPANLQQLVGNRAVQRLLSPTGGSSQGFELDESTATQIDRQRGSGQPLDHVTQDQMEPALGYDFQGVRLHTGPQADQLNRDLNAQAFTTGQDIFFREGAYNPQDTEGQRLIAHELSHVVQQGTGAVSGTGERMTVNPPGDTFEQQADTAAHTATHPQHQVQRQETDEEELIQMQEDTQEEELVQMQEYPEEEELVQRQSDEDEEEEELMP